MKPFTLSLVGLGWLGLPLAKHLQERGMSVRGSTTTPDKLAALRAQGLAAYPLRLDPAPVGDIAPLLDADYLVVNVPPKAGKQGDDFHPEQMRLLTDAVRNSPVQHVLYVSSTSVYPDQNRLMQEDDVVTPNQSAAPALVVAERSWLSLAPERAITIVRCAGLMGGSRIPGKYVAGRTVDSGAVRVNYIHQVDVVRLLTAVIDQRLTGTFNAVAPQHPTREAIYRKSCADFGYALPTFVAPPEPLPFKLIDGAKLIQATNYAFQYPNPLDFPYAE